MRAWATRLGALAFAASAFFAGSAQAATYGLVIGIDRYEHLPRLGGAVNDARDIAQALHTIGAKKVTTLLDAKASRDAIFAAWNELVKLAQPGDTIVFSYAGHGGQEPERIAGNEPEDGLDEVFQLAAFHPSTPANRERIIDDEINLMFAKAKHVKIVFIADSCHSGTMTRGFDSRAGVLRTRLGGYGKITNDALPPPDPDAAQITIEALRNVLYFGAVRDGQVVQEFLIDKQARGALSWSFARALRGHADLDEDGVVNTSELERYLIENVRTRSDSRQSPQMTPRGDPAQVAIPVGTPEAQAVSKDLALNILNALDRGNLIKQLNDVVAAKRNQADLTWDYATGEIVSSSGDVVARLGRQTSAKSVQPIIDKWHLLRELEELAQSRPLTLRLDKKDGVHRAGTRLNIELSGHRHTKLIAFNLAVDGTVQYIIPEPLSPYPFYHGKLVAGEKFEFPLDVSKPFGADHFVALAVPEYNTDLLRVLEGLNNQKAARALRGKLIRLLKGKDFQLGQVGLFTAP